MSPKREDRGLAAACQDADGRLSTPPGLMAVPTGPQQPGCCAGNKQLHALCLETSLPLCLHAPPGHACDLPYL